MKEAIEDKIEEEKKSKNDDPFEASQIISMRNVDESPVKELGEDDSVSRLTYEDKGAMSEEEKLPPQE